jgi:hypothetical protein
MGNCSSTSKCNPCGPNYDAINLLANKTASYARQANTSAVDAANSATDAENYWKEFNALYLGSFASAPTVDNEGNPLQEGALYFNSVSNQMFVWQGASWIDFDFDEFTPFLATGTTTARNLVTRFSEMPSIFDFGAVGNGVADDLPAFTAANNSGKLIFIPKPPVSYNVSAPIKMDKCAVLLDPSATWQQLTDSGNINYLRGKQVDNPGPPVAESANVWRFSDMVYIGDAAKTLTGASGNAGNSWMADPSLISGYLGVNGKLVVSTGPNQSIYCDKPYGIISGVRNSDTCQSAIGIGAVALNDTTGANQFTWGGIFEVRTQNPNTTSFGVEINVGNCTSPYIGPSLTPYGPVLGGFTIGVALGGGGDPVMGPAITGPSSCGIYLGGTNNNEGWKTGICFRGFSINGTEGSSLVSEPEAIAFCARHSLRWYEPTTNTVTGTIQCSNTIAGTKTRIGLGSNLISYTNNANKSFFLAVSQSPNSVNRIQTTGTDAGTNPTIGVDGDDTNLDLTLLAKGTGRIRYGTNVATSDVPITSYIEIKDAAGNIRKLAVIS